MSSKPAVRKIVFHPEKCIVCLLCQIFCSLRYTGAVNPLKARTRVYREDDVNVKVVFTEECTMCGLCVDVCPTGARELV